MSRDFAIKVMDNKIIILPLGRLSLGMLADIRRFIGLGYLVEIW